MRPRFIQVLVLLITLFILSACTSQQPSEQKNSSKAALKKIVVTHSILGAVVKELAGNKAEVTVLIPNGQDLHVWEPSAKAIEALYKADLIVQNGLGLEASLTKTIQQAEKNGVAIFTATDYIDIRKVGEGEFVEEAEDEHDNENYHGTGAPDPHFWTDPIAMKNAAAALASTLQKKLNIDTSNEAASLNNKFDQLHQELTQMVEQIPQQERKLVSGHESLGYFADRYGFKLIGAIIPSTTTETEVSAADIVSLKKVIQEQHVKAVFSELGTPKQLSETIASETGAKVIELNTHILPNDGSYFTFMRELTQTIVKGLQ